MSQCGKGFRSAIVGILLTLSRTAGWCSDDAHRVGAVKGPYFVCDARNIEDRWLIERHVVPARRFSELPVMEGAFAWEGSGPHMGGSVVRDPVAGRFRMWYSVFDADAYANRKPFSYNVCYAESTDGLAWQRPALGLFDYRGNRANNVVRLGNDKSQNVDVCLNPRPNRWPGKFLAIHNQKGGVFVTFSDDGATFRRLFDKPAIAYHSDTHNNFVYDEARDRWLLYCRPRAWIGYHRRRVAMKTSRDLEHWTHERTILLPTETEIPEYYGMGVFRRGDTFFGIVQVYETKSGAMHGELAWSGDGERWEFLPTHPAFLTLGKPGSWDAGMAMAAESPVEVGNELRFYYGGFRKSHNAPPGENRAAIGLMVAERDRLVGLRSVAKEVGGILTRPLLLVNRHLVINAIVRGRILAEVRTDDNKPVAGFAFADCDPVTASSFAAPVRWQGRSIGDANAKEIRIAFRLQDAELYTFDITP